MAATENVPTLRRIAETPYGELSPEDIETTQELLKPAQIEFVLELAARQQPPNTGLIEALTKAPKNEVIN